MKTETFEKTVTTEEYIKEYVNVEEFLEYCKACKNYKKIWACPEYDFDPCDYWKKYEYIYIIGRKIYTDEIKDNEQWKKLYLEEKHRMSEELYHLEEEKPGSISLCAGSCDLCYEAGCTRASGEPCRYPDKMRYSIESLGGNVGLTASKLLGIEIKWMEENALPEYFVLVGGLLYEPRND